MKAHGRIDQLPFRRRSPADYEEMYADAPPWEINRPQRAFTELAASGALRGRVLDAGCGTGEHALLAASLGLDATGIDSSETAIAIAARKARSRRLRARFLVMDAVELTLLGEAFDVVLDSGLFHVLDDEQRAGYEMALRQLVAPNGRVHILCFSDQEPGDKGPRRVSEAELRATFFTGWQVVRIVRTTIDRVDGEGVVQALLAEFLSESNVLIEEQRSRVLEP